jgi:protein O-GlcNAc transferase
VIADPIVLPLADAVNYVERIVHLPESYQVNDRLRQIGTDTTREREGLPPHSFVFCCFNQPFKISRLIFDVWMRLLSSVGESVLWLYAENEDAPVNLRREAALWRIAPERLVFCQGVGLEQHLARHKCADLCLDTLPYSSHSTGSNALWAGVPMVTCLGTTFAGRVGASLLTAVGLPDLIARSMEEYEALASRLATTPALLHDVRERLSRTQMMHPLFDTDRFRAHLERAYLTMWERFARGEAPAHLSIPPEPPRNAPMELPYRVATAARG